MNRPDSDLQGCTVYEPPGATNAVLVADCYSDGHYLCRACQRFVGEEEQQRVLNPPWIRLYTIVRRPA